MARNEEKAQSMLNRFITMKQEEKRKPRERRPYLASECRDLADAERWRSEILREIGAKVAEIQNEGLGEHRLRDLNDEINKLLRERGHWERRIVELGGRDYSRSSNAPLMTDLDGNIVAVPNPSGRGPGYRYFGAARKLPGVRELFDKPPEIRKRRTRYEIHKRINARYYGNIGTCMLALLIFCWQCQFQMAQDYFQPVAGGILVDVSCGSGLFTRKFAKSGTYSAVIALDFSENMLRQCYEFVKQDDTLLNANLALVRSDISRLPFASCSVDAIHAGAAIHCWPSPSNAVAEISRVLRPGGVFVGTTFLSSPRNNPFSVDALRPLRQIVGPVNTSYNYFTQGELEDLCKSCGLVNYSSKVQRSFIMFSGQNHTE